MQARRAKVVRESVPRALARPRLAQGRDDSCMCTSTRLHCFYLTEHDIAGGRVAQAAHESHRALHKHDPALWPVLPVRFLTCKLIQQL